MSIEVTFPVIRSFSAISGPHECCTGLALILVQAAVSHFCRFAGGSHDYHTAEI